MRVCILYRGVSVAALVGLGACASAPRPSPVTASAPPNVTWERWAATDTDDAFERVAVGSDGAVYATGRDGHGAFVARFAPDGARSWRHTLHGVTAGAPPSVAVSRAGRTSSSRPSAVAEPTVGRARSGAKGSIRPPPWP